MLNLHLAKDENDIIEASIPYLQTFINEFQGFYPFAMIMDKQKKISSLAPEEEEEYSIQYLIDFYEEAIENEINNTDSEYYLAVICIDIFIHEKIESIETKKNAIEFRLIASSNRKTVKLIYEINDKNEVILKDWIF